MKDITAIKRFLTNHGVDFVHNPYVVTGEPFSGIGPDVTVQEIVLEAQTKKVVGYGGFRAKFYFNLEGELISIGVWE